VWREVVEPGEWIWVTDLLQAAVPAAKIQRWGHDRWDVENRGFNELATLRHMDHCFVHEPTAIEALLLTLSAAFLLTHLFYESSCCRSCQFQYPTARDAELLEQTARP